MVTFVNGEFVFAHDHRLGNVESYKLNSTNSSRSCLI